MDGKLSSDSDSIDLISSMIKNQGSYIYSKLPKSEKAVFLATMESLQALCLNSSNLTNLKYNMISYAEDNLKERHFIFRMVSNPLPTKRLAYSTVEQIVESVQIRFIDGGSKTYLSLFEGRVAR